MKLKSCLLFYSSWPYSSIKEYETGATKFIIYLCLFISNYTVPNFKSKGAFIMSYSSSALQFSTVLRKSRYSTLDLYALGNIYLLWFSLDLLHSCTNCFTLYGLILWNMSSLSILYLFPSTVNTSFSFLTFFFLSFLSSYSVANYSSLFKCAESFA